jgi:hypothetical protein
MASRRVVKEVLTFVGKGAHATSSSTRKASTLMRLKATIGDSSDTESREWESKNDDKKISLSEVYRTESSHPLKDFVSENYASNFVVTWPLHDDGDGLARRILDALDGMREGSSIRVTTPFHILDGKGDKMASLCVVTRLGQTSNESIEPEGWGSPGEWTNLIQ